MAEKFSLKDYLFNQEKVTYLADLLVHARPTFAGKDFITKVMSEMLELELKIGYV
jgi:hypothetical protein